MQSPSRHPIRIDGASQNKWEGYRTGSKFLPINPAPRQRLLQLGNARLGHAGGAQVENDEIGEARQLLQAGVGDLGSVQRKREELLVAANCLETLIGHIGSPQFQRLE